MRTLRTLQWPKYLKTICQSINNKPCRYIGYLKPGDIHSSAQDPEIAAAKLKHGIDAMQTHWEEWQKNQTAYEQSRSPLQVGTFVFASFGKSSFYKSFDYQKGQIYQISRVDARIKPVLYHLKDLLNDDFPGAF